MNYFMAQLLPYRSGFFSVDVPLRTASANGKCFFFSWRPKQMSYAARRCYDYGLFSIKGREMINDHALEMRL